MANTESNGRFHSDWLDMMYPRLKLARNLLKDDGVIFISIDDNEQANLKRMCDEVYGEANFIVNVIWRSKDNSNNDAKRFSLDHNHTLIYSKNIDWQPNKLSDESKRSHFKNPNNDPLGPYFDGNPLNSPNYRENLIYDLVTPSGKIIPSPKNGWRWSKKSMEEKIKTGEIKFTNNETSIKRRTYLADMKGLPPSSLWTDLDKTGHNRQAKYELLKLIPEDAFSTPKPVKLVKHILELATRNTDDVILDFFAGSSTTAHAVMQLNAEDGGNRKFIMVQLPEVTDEKSEAYKAGYSTIAEISKERIRRAGKKIKEELTTKHTNNTKGKAKETSKQSSSSEADDFSVFSVFRGSKELDTGFRVLKVDSSNMKDVYYAPDAMTQGDLVDQTDNIKEDRTAEDLLFQVLLDWGVDLSLPIVRETITTKHTKKMKEETKEFEVFFVDGSYNTPALCACFEKEINEDLVKQIAKREPLRAVFRDAGYGSDSTKINIKQIFKLVSPHTEVKAI